ncbi:MAG TPA: hypothetical protein DDW52_09950 [Planctomycetaceae bacterium]|nr:hypothetical protein [Planctomycetaceae bacterium]
MNSFGSPTFRSRPGSLRLRGGYTLIEMLVASASATVLIAGLGSSVYIVSRAFDDADGTVVQELDSSLVLEDMLADIQLAERFTVRSSNQVEFTVPDRDGDGADETISYTWSGTEGDPLLRVVNGSSPEAVVASVANLSFDFETRVTPGVEAPIVFVPKVIFESFEETKTSGDDDLVLVLDVPADTIADDLLIVAIAAEGDRRSTFSNAIPDWNLIVNESRNGDITLGVWWRVATDGEPASYSFKVGGEETGAYGWMMRFSGHDPADPISSTSVGSGRSATPIVPAAKVPTEQSMVLRLGAFEDNSFNQDQTEITNATTITMDGVSNASGGAAYSTQDEIGSTSTAEFGLTAKEDYVTATVVIKPAQETP